MSRSVRHRSTSPAQGRRAPHQPQDSSAPTGKLMLNVPGSIAQFEREIMLERQREGIARAKANGLYKGRKPTTQQHKDKITALHQQGVGIAGILKQIRSMEDKD